MIAEPHVIVYAAPSHEGIPTVECSCGWSATGDDAGGQVQCDGLSELLAQWLEHVAAGQEGLVE